MAYWGYYNNFYGRGGFNRDPWGTYTGYPGGADDVYRTSHRSPSIDLGGYAETIHSSVAAAAGASTGARNSGGGVDDRSARDSSFGRGAGLRSGAGGRLYYVQDRDGWYSATPMAGRWGNHRYAPGHRAGPARWWHSGPESGWISRHDLDPGDCVVM